MRSRLYKAFCPNTANPLLLYPSTLVCINHHLQGLSPHKRNSRRPVSYQHTTCQFKNQNHTKSPQTPTYFIPISPLHIHAHTRGIFMCSFLLWTCRLCGNYLIPNNLQSHTWPQLCMCSSSPLTKCWDITFIWIGRPFVTNLAAELTFKALIQAVELQWNRILLHSLLHHMVHPLLYNYMVPKGYL